VIFERGAAFLALSFKTSSASSIIKLPSLSYKSSILYIACPDAAFCEVFDATFLEVVDLALTAETIIGSTTRLDAVFLVVPFGAELVVPLGPLTVFLLTI
jgi:hypothetical protein